MGLSGEGKSPHPSIKMAKGTSSTAPSQPLRALSPNVAVVQSEQVPFRRLTMTKEEMEAINQGGNEVSDWTKIKLRA